VIGNGGWSREQRSLQFSACDKGGTDPGKHLRTKSNSRKKINTIEGSSTAKKRINGRAEDILKCVREKKLKKVCAYEAARSAT